MIDRAKLGFGGAMLLAATAIAACSHDVEVGEQGTGGAAATSGTTSASSNSGTGSTSTSVGAGGAGGACTLGQDPLQCAADADCAANGAICGMSGICACAAAGSGGATTGATTATTGAGGNAGACTLGQDPLGCNAASDCAPYDAVCDFATMICACCWYQDPIDCSTDADCSPHGVCKSGSCGCN